MLLTRRFKVSCTTPEGKVQRELEVQALCGWSGIAARKFIHTYFHGYVMTGIRYEAPTTDSTEAYNHGLQHGIKVWIERIDDAGQTS